MNRQALGVALLLMCAGSGLASAQTARTTPDELRSQVDRRFDVLVVRDGLALRPRVPMGDVRTIEVRGGEIILDGASATGAELRRSLGADADLVIQLSYLEAAEQRTLFSEAARGRVLPEAPLPPSPSGTVEPPGSRRTRRSGDRVRVGGSVRVESDEVVQGDVVAIGGSARVFGEVHGDVVAIGGFVELGPNAFVRRSVTVVGGTLRREPTARIEGEINEIGLGMIDLSGLRWTPPSLGPLWWGWTFGAAYSLLATLVRVAVLCLLAALVMLLGRDYVERISTLAAAEPVKSGAIGFLAQVLFLPILVITIILLVVTIIGIPLILLIPFAILGLGIFGLVGFTAVAYHVGRLLVARMKWANVSPFGVTIAGIILLLSPVLLARLIGLGGGITYPMTLGLGLIGILIEYVAWTVGFGAVALARFSKTSVTHAMP